jgi:hypothetical protein
MKDLQTVHSELFSTELCWLGAVSIHSRKMQLHDTKRIIQSITLTLQVVPYLQSNYRHNVCKCTQWNVFERSILRTFSDEMAKLIIWVGGNSFGVTAAIRLSLSDWQTHSNNICSFLRSNEVFNGNLPQNMKLLISAPVCSVFNHFFSNEDYIASNERVIREWWIGWWFILRRFFSN